MDIVLISEDRELYRVCLEILDEILHQPWTLSAASPDDAISQADLCIWDYQADVPLPNYGDRVPPSISIWSAGRTCRNSAGKWQSRKPTSCSSRLPR